MAGSFGEMLDELLQATQDARAREEKVDADDARWIFNEPPGGDKTPTWLAGIGDGSIAPVSPNKETQPSGNKGGETDSFQQQWWKDFQQAVASPSQLNNQAGVASSNGNIAPMGVASQGSANFAMSNSRATQVASPDAMQAEAEKDSDKEESSQDELIKAVKELTEVLRKSLGDTAKKEGHSWEEPTASTKAMNSIGVFFRNLNG